MVPDAPVLGVEEAADLGVLRRRDHAWASAPGGTPVAGVDERGVPDEAAAPAAAGTAHGARTDRTRGSGIGRDLLAVARARRRWRQRREDARAGDRRGSLMRHFLAPPPIAVLAGGVVQAAAPAVLVAAGGGVERGGARVLSAPPGAVAIAAITVAAEKEHLAAFDARTDDEPEGIHASLRTGRRGGQSRPGVRSENNAESRVPCGIQPEGPGWSDSGPSPFSASAGPIYRSINTDTSPPYPIQISALLGGQQHGTQCLGCDDAAGCAEDPRPKNARAHLAQEAHGGRPYRAIPAARYLSAAGRPGCRPATPPRPDRSRVKKRDL